MSDKKVFFNCSMPRSGSTLLQNILAQNPRFYCSPSSALLALLEATRSTFSNHDFFNTQDAELMSKGYLSFCRHGLLGFYEGITDKPVAIDKNRVWINYYEWINSFYPNPKIVVCTRDLRAVMASMEKRFRKTRATDTADVIGYWKGMSLLTIANRVGVWMNSVPVGFSIMSIMDALQRGVGKHIHFLRYEDLAFNPKGAMQRIYEYFGEPYYEHDFDNVKQVTHEDDSLLAVYADHKIHEGRVCPAPLDYDEFLGKALCDHIVHTFPQFYEAFYPEVLGRN
jgi:sulfotransferase